VLAAIIVILWITSCVWVHRDARELTVRAAKDKANARLPAGPWAVACIALWIVFFPAYLVRRELFKRAHNLI
jgi:heme/copper-type cytochrome/quinol oxidase subunit 2